LSEIRDLVQRADGARTPAERIASALEGIRLELGAIHACQRRTERATVRMAELLTREYAEDEDDV
jgi:hypothetical protein